MTLEPGPARRPAGKSLLRAGVVLLAIAPLAWAARSQWTEIAATLAQSDWGLVLAGWVILILAQPLMGAISWLVLRGLDQAFPFVKITSVYFISQAAKYLPGGIWAFPGRVLAYQAIGVSREASVISLVQEVGALFLGAALVGLMGLALGVASVDWVRAALATGIGISIGAILLTQHPLIWRLASKVGWGRSQLRGAETAPARLNLHWLPRALPAALLFWLLVGWGFRVLAGGIDPAASELSLMQVAGIFGLAWCAGFIVVIAPAGLGVREAALTALLAPHLGLSSALSISLVARLWWTLGEGVFILLSLLWASGRIGGQAGSGPVKFT